MMALPRREPAKRRGSVAARLRGLIDKRALWQPGAGDLIAQIIVRGPAQCSFVLR